MPTIPSSRLVVSIALLAGLTRAPVAAQVNIEATRTDDLPAGVSGQLGGTLAIQTGNVDLVQTAFSGRIYRVTGPLTTMVVGNGGIGLPGGSRFASSGLLHGRQTRRVNEWLSPEWFGQLNYDQTRLLSFRLVAGGGARIHVTEGPWGRISGGSSLILEHERISLPETALHPSRTTVIRSSTFVAVRLVSAEQLVVTSTAYVQPQVGELGDIRILENLNLSVGVTARVAVTVAFDLRYDSRPPDGIAGLDTSLRSGVTLTY